jgi:asparagine synthase (glutamine-hydrolysing)
MCGITGIYAFNQIGRFQMINAARATEALHTRGPDFQRTINNEYASFGHRRLSIIDTSPAGNQPIEDERNWLVFNGEIYNYRQLRSELESAGESFYSHSDSEVLFRLLKSRGSEGIEKLQGDFAFAFYDAAEDSVLIARDRFGVKPLYYFKDEDKFIFASEIKSILSYGLDLELDHDALLIYLQLNYIPAPLTIFKNVSKVLPGHYLRISRSGILDESYYELSPEKSNLTFQNATAKLAELLEESVKDQLVADVPLGSFLSGGLDSSIIALLAKKHKPDLHTFSIGFRGNKFFDESDYSKLVSKHINSNHTVFEFAEKDLLEQVFASLDYLDEPFADSSAIAVNLLSRETRKHSTVALSGDGSDELFGGYNKHTAWVKSLEGESGWIKSFVPALSLLPGSRSGAFGNRVRQLRKFGAGVKLPTKERYWLWASLTDENGAKSLLSENSKSNLSLENSEILKKTWLRFLDKENLNRHLLTDLHMVLPDDMLTKVDRMSMAHGLEVRVPFLDKRVAEFAFSLPGHFKNDGKQSKIILKEAFKSQLPPGIIHRSKKGFEVPVLKWLRKDLKKIISDDLLSESLLNQQGIFNSGEVKKLLRKLHSMNPGDSHARVWALVCFQWWWKKYYHF